MRKFVAKRTATEDWERNNVYGSTFPQWQNPIQDFIKPMIYKAANRNTLAAAGSLGVISAMMWRTPRTRATAGFFGAALGLAVGATTETEDVFGERFIPKRRKQELALEEYSDILKFVKNKKLFEQASAMGDDLLAQESKKQMKQTMYGADIYGGSIQELAQAIPKRKREHFREMIAAPEQERARILSTAPRLERRIYEAAWGMDVEKRPELEEYFQEHELPTADWEGWSPDVDMEQVKIKMIQHQGLDAAQMGYFPQQLQQANLLNLSYPDFGRKSGSSADVGAQLRVLMANSGANGQVTARRTPFPGTRLDMQLGVG
jgi:hypothetical protein